MAELSESEIYEAQRLDRLGVPVSEIARQLGCTWWNAKCAIDPEYREDNTAANRKRRAAAAPLNDAEKYAIRARMRACDQHLKDLERVYVRPPLDVLSERPKLIRRLSHDHSFCGSPAFQCVEG